MIVNNVNNLSFNNQSTCHVNNIDPEINFNRKYQIFSKYQMFTMIITPIIMNCYLLFDYSPNLFAMILHTV